MLMMMMNHQRMLYSERKWEPTRTPKTSVDMMMIVKTDNDDDATQENYEQ